MSVVLLNDRLLHYEVLGRGRPVIFIHGWVGSWRYWIPAMQAASTNFRAYAMDLWGFGDSAHETTRYSLDQQVEGVSNFLQLLGILKIALVGHGLGAITAMFFTRLYPDLVDRLMLVDCPLSMNAIQPRLRNGSPAELAEWLLAKDPSTDAVRSDALKTDPKAITEFFGDLEGANLPALISEMRTPCLLVHGQNDPAIIPPDAERMASFPERVHQIVLEGSSHFPMLDEVSRFNRLLADFLALDSGESPRALQLKEEWKRRVR
jgi:pimeloyl-ACP methyl ester carboxylesterase